MREDTRIRSLLGWMHSILHDRDLEEAVIRVQGLVSPQGTSLEAHVYTRRAFLYSWDLSPLDEGVGSRILKFAAHQS